MGPAEERRTKPVAAEILGLARQSHTEYVDERGTFVRLLDDALGATNGSPICQLSLSANSQAGTLRGMHALLREATEWKAVSCIRGSILDVCIDCREESPTYRQVVMQELAGLRPQSLTIPPGVLHGYITLSTDAWVLYGMTAEYDPNLEYGVRWDDPLLGIDWPISPTVVSTKDQSWPILTEPPVL